MIIFQLGVYTFQAIVKIPQSTHSAGFLLSQSYPDWVKLLSFGWNRMALQDLSKSLEVFFRKRMIGQFTVEEFVITN